MAVDQTSLDRIRNASFPTVRRGYDKGEVERFLTKLADWLETGAGDESRTDAVKRELERIGQRTSAILAQAEDSASQIRREAETEAADLLTSAKRESEGLLAKAKKTSGDAAKKAEQLLSESKKKAETEAKALIEKAKTEADGILDDAARRKSDIESVIDDLYERRDETVADLETLASKLVEAARQHAGDDGSAAKSKVGSGKQKASAKSKS